MKTRLLPSLLMGLVAITFLPAAYAQVPGIINYHGVLESNGNKYHGDGSFRFALVNDGNPAMVTYWSNDGSSIAGGQPTGAVTVEVDDGLFTVALGDTSLLGMTAIPASVFSNPNVYLRIWFDDGNGIELLAPDQRITAVGYAMRAATVSDGAISGNNLADGSVTTPKLADGAVTGVKIATPAIHTVHLGDGVVLTGKIADGAVTTAKIADAAVTAAKLAPGVIGTEQVANNSLTSADIADTLTLQRLNLGGLDWDGSLNLYSKPAGGGGGILNPSGEWRGFMVADDFGAELDLFFGNGKTGAVLSARAPGGRLQLTDLLGTPTALLGSTTGGGDLNLFQINGDVGIRLNGDRATYDNQGTAGGEISVHTAGGSVGVLIDGDHSNAGRIEVRQPGLGIPFVDIFGRGANEGGEIWMKDQTGGQTIRLDGAGSDASLTSDGLLRLGRTAQANLVFDNNEITARDNGAAAPLFLNPNQGNVVIGRTSELAPDARLLVESDEAQDALRVRVGTSTKLYVAGDGRVGINTTNLASGFELSVRGQVIVEELVVQNYASWPDYVFADDYDLMSLDELEASIRQNRHLPGVPKASEVEGAGISIGDMQRRMMEKIEELTLYVLQQNKRLSAQEAELENLRGRVAR
jgi:hypothetical protein